VIDVSLLQISGAVAGGLVGSFSGFLANTVHDVRERQRTRRNLACALIGEIDVLSQYIQVYLDLLRESMRGDQPRHHFRGERDYTSVYRSIGAGIGLLPTPLPRDLVAWYTGFATGLERAHALHDLTASGDPDLNDHAQKLGELQETSFKKLLADAKPLLEQLSQL
jgi:hypothetical protein